jgi:hypothetical protein
MLMSRNKDVINKIMSLKTPRELDHSTYISLKNKYVFFQVSKAGSSTIKYYLQSQEVIGTGRKVINVNNTDLSPHVSPSQLDPVMFVDIIRSSEYKKIAFVRNPYSRLLSCYLHRIIGNPKSPSNKWLKRFTGGLGGPEISFSDFIKVVSNQKSKDQERHWRNQHDEIFYDLLNNWSFIGKFENLGEDIAAMMYLTFGKSIWFRRKPVNKSPMTTNASNKLKEYYSDDLIELVYKGYKNDFDAFGYDKDLPI